MNAAETARVEKMKARIVNLQERLRATKLKTSGRRTASATASTAGTGRGKPKTASSKGRGRAPARSARKRPSQAPSANV